MVPLWLAKQQQQQRWLLPWLSYHLLLPSSRLRLLTGLCPFSNATPSPPLPPAEPAHFMVDYLVGSCGLSSSHAAKAARHLAHLKSSERPDAVLRLLKEVGLCGSQIRRLVQTFPRVLVADPEMTLEPKIRALQEAGFSKPELAELISVNSYAIRRRDAARKIEIWRKLIGNNQKLLKVAKNTHMLSHKEAGTAHPNLCFLRSVGLPDEEILRIVVKCPRLITTKLERIMSIVERVKSLGIAPGSKKFRKALSSVFQLSLTTLEAKSKLLRSYGWSEDELLLAIQTWPEILTLSEEKIGRAMDFLLNRAGCQPSYVAQHSVLLSYSIDRRLLPRYCVLQFLKKKGQPRGDVELVTVMVASERKFVEKYINPIRENVPEMLETYPMISAMRIAL